PGIREGQPGASQGRPGARRARAHRRRRARDGRHGRSGRPPRRAAGRSNRGAVLSDRARGPFGPGKAGRSSGARRPATIGPEPPKENRSFRRGTPPAAMSAEKILIVDDDDDILLIVQTILASAGYSAFVAHNGREGVDLARELGPDLI